MTATDWKAPYTPRYIAEFFPGVESLVAAQVLSHSSREVLTILEPQNDRGVKLTRAGW